MDATMKNAKHTVLIVDDEPDAIMIEAELFKSLGWNVLTASNGDEAIQMICAGNKINVLFSDVMMPNGVSGIGLCHTISKYFPHIKIILCSGHPLPVLEDEYGNLDNFMFMQKPFRVNDLVRNLIQRMQ
jgi:CheY-like chemotaxis protein